MIKIRLLDDYAISVFLTEESPLNTTLLDGNNYIGVTLFDENEVGNIEFGTSNSEIEVSFDIGTVIEGGEYPLYGGPYQAIPKVYPQFFETGHKSMKENFTVFEIPYQEVSNPQGGETVIIAFD